MSKLLKLATLSKNEFEFSYWRVFLQIYSMSQNCKTTYTASTTRDANNNTLYHGSPTPGYGARGGFPPASVSNGNYQVIRISYPTYA